MLKSCHVFCSCRFYQKLVLRNFYYLYIILTMPKYAVAVGRNVGVYDSWEQCKQQVNKFPNAVFKKFETREEANYFIEENSYVRPADYRPNRNNYQSSSYSDSNSPSTAFEEDNYFDRYQSNYEVASNNSASFGSLEGYTNVYTDGACTNNGRFGAKAGIGVYFGPNSPLNISEPVVGPATNNNAEIQAAYRAIIQARLHGITKLNIHTDSRFMIDCVTQWMPKWKKNGWILSNGGYVKNKHELMKLDSEMKYIDVVFTYVPSHAGVEGNEMADKLARQGAEMY